MTSEDISFIARFIHLLFLSVIFPAANFWKYQDVYTYLDPGVTRTDIVSPVSWFVFFFFLCSSYNTEQNSFYSIRDASFSVRADVSLMMWALQVCTEMVFGTCFAVWARELNGVYAIHSLWNVIYEICVARKWLFLAEVTGCFLLGCLPPHLWTKEVSKWRYSPFWKRFFFFLMIVSKKKNHNITLLYYSC